MDFDFDQINQMLGNMSEEELQNLQDTAQSFFAGFGGDDGGPEEPPPDGGFGGAGGGFGSGFSPEMLAQLSKLMQRMNARDPRTDLIRALKPHLSRRRQQRAEQAVQMMKMMELLPAMKHVMR